MYSTTESLGKSCVFVTGGSGDIGAKTAASLASRGASVAIGYHRNANKAREVAASIIDCGGNAICVAADLSDESQVDRAFTQIEDALGSVDILVNNAGTHRGDRIQQLDVGAWRQVLEANLTSAFLCSRRATPAMIDRGWGRIVNVTSVVGLNGFPGDTAYAAAKAGLVGFTKALALELARDGVAVNAIAPGFVDSEMTGALPEPVLERIKRSIPAKRQATVAEIAQTIEFLATGPDYMTGTVVVVDGGWTIS